MKKKTLAQIKAETAAKIAKGQDGAGKRGAEKKKMGKDTKDTPKTPVNENKGGNSKEVKKSITGRVYKKADGDRVKEPGVGSGNGSGSKQSQFGADPNNPQKNPLSGKNWCEFMSGGEQEFEDTKRLKYKTSKDRKIVFEKILEHVRSGYSPDCFPGIGIKTIWLYIEKFPDDFPAGELMAAGREGLYGWQRIGRSQALGRGDAAKGKTAALFMFMENLYRWMHRQDLTNDGERFEAPQILHAYPPKLPEPKQPENK